MDRFTPEQKQRIVSALEERGVTLPCPRCGNATFELVDGYFNQPVQEGLESFSIGGPSIPSVVITCSRCGYMTQHAIGALGLLNREEAVR